MVLSGCAGSGVLPSPPNVNEFPNSGLNFQLNGKVGENTQRLLSFLNSIPLRHDQAIRNPYTFIITAYEYETIEEGIQRDRVVSYLIRFNPSFDQENCTDVSFSWVVKSSGFKETDWTITSRDEKHIPTSRDNLIEFFNKYKYEL